MVCKRGRERVKAREERGELFPYFKNDPEKSLVEAEPWRLDRSPLVSIMSIIHHNIM